MPEPHGIEVSGSFTPGQSYLIISEGTTDWNYVAGTAHTEDSTLADSTFSDIIYRVGDTFTCVHPAPSDSSGTGKARAVDLAGSFNISQKYIIAKLGTTDWNVVAGTTGVTYKEGDIITAVDAGSGTGAASRITVDLGRIGGKALKNNLERHGIDLAVRNGPLDDPVLYLRVDPSVKTIVSAYDLEAGVLYQIRALNNTDFTTVGASSNGVGVVFKATGPVTPHFGSPGTVFEIENAADPNPTLASGRSGIGFNTDTPIYELDVNSEIKTINAEATNTATIDNVIFNAQGFITTKVGPIYMDPLGEDSTNGEFSYFAFDRMTSDNLAFNGNVISSYTSNTDIRFIPNASAEINLEANTNVYGNISATGNITLDGDLSSKGNILIGDKELDVVVLNVEFEQSIIPGVDNKLSLGQEAYDSTARRWSEFHTPDLTNVETIIPLGAVVNNRLTVDGVLNRIGTTGNVFDLSTGRVLKYGTNAAVHDIVYSPSIGLSFTKDAIPVKPNILSTNTYGEATPPHLMYISFYTADGNTLLAKIKVNGISKVPSVKDFPDAVVSGDPLTGSSIYDAEVLYPAGQDFNDVFDPISSSSPFSPGNYFVKIDEEPDVFISPNTGVNYIESLKIEGNVFTNLIETPTLNATALTNSLNDALQGDSDANALWSTPGSATEIIVVGPGSTIEQTRTAPLGDIFNDPTDPDVTDENDESTLASVASLIGGNLNQQLWYHQAIKPHIYADEGLYEEFGNGASLDATPLTFATTGTGYIRFDGNNGVVIPAGTTAEREYTEVGETRWNTELNYLECFDGSVYVISTGPGEVVSTDLMTDLAIARALMLG
jgi:hypothetical protein